MAGLGNDTMIINTHREADPERVRYVDHILPRTDGHPLGRPAHGYAFRTRVDGPRAGQWVHKWDLFNETQIADAILKGAIVVIGRDPTRREHE